MHPRRSIRRPVCSVARMLRAPHAPRAVRALLMGVMLASVLIGGDCHWAFSSNTSDDSSRDGGTTVIVTDLTMGDGAPEPVGRAQLDPALLEMEEVFILVSTREEFAAYRAAGGTARPPLFEAAIQNSWQPYVFAGLSPARIWPPERIGEAELAAFAAGVLAANEEVLGLPVAVANLQYLDTEVADGVASVRFGERGDGGQALAIRFGPSGELIAIERLPLPFEKRDRTPNWR